MALRVVITAYVRFGNALAWHALEVARGLHAAGHEVLLLCKKGSPLAQWSFSVPFLVNCDLDASSADPSEVVRGWKILRRAVRDFHPDMLNPHCPPGHSWLALLRTFDNRTVPLIRTVADPRPPSRNPLNWILHHRYTDGIIFTTASSLQRYENSVDLGRIRHQVILPGFRAEDFVKDVQPGNYRALLGVKPDQLLVGIIARMSPEKGQEVFLEALSLLDHSERGKLFCVMAGEDSRERGQAALRSIAQQLGVNDHVAFMKRLDDVRPLMSELDVGVITSIRSEAICRVALEYMSFGIPVIASDVNILPEVVLNGRNGFTFPNQDARALAGCLRSLLSNAEERKRLGARGREMAGTTLSIHREIEQTVEFYQTIRSHSRRSRA